MGHLLGSMGQMVQIEMDDTEGNGKMIHMGQNFSLTEVVEHYV